MLVKAIMKVLSNLMGNGSKIKYTEVAVQRDGTNLNIKEYVDGVVESGSNANGSYVKYADGTMICTKTISGTGTFSMWYSPIIFLDVSIGSLPETFTSIICAMGTSTSPLTVCGNISGTTTSDGGTARMIGFDTASRSKSYALNVMIIGKWK